MPKNNEDEVKKDVESILSLEKQLADTEAELMADEKFRSFLTFQKKAKESISVYWQTIENAMINNDIKKISGDWGYLTIVEKLSFDYTDELPRSYKKLVPDEKKIADTFRLNGKPVKGTTPKYRKYLRKGIK